MLKKRPNIGRFFNNPYKTTLEMLEESAEEMGLDLTEMDLAESSNEERIKDKIVKNHACCRAARNFVRPGFDQQTPQRP